MGRPVDTPERGGAELAELLAGYAAVGVTEVHVMPMSGDPIDSVDAMGQHVVPRVTDLD